MAARNHLAHQTSPYLLQHADNPVDWYPWNQQALEHAKREDKPILLSIGYSACHWCHVMAHESFEDEETARVMNALFVNIKVDREERPDLDKIYQMAHQLLTQRPGGWPLTMFLTPEDQVPFFGGTYFPKEPRHGLPALRELLQRVSAFYREHRADIKRQNASMVGAINSIYTQQRATQPLRAEDLKAARDQLLASFDRRFGGFGGAPKFPHPTSIERLMRHWAHNHVQGGDDQEALQAAQHTLKMMALGGVYDQLGGGFCRYSVDDFWMIPHFEKMLYDNGPLLALYTQAAATGNKLFARIAHETAAWVIREMQAPEGGYFSTLDADSEGEEGKFYVWTTTSVREIVDSAHYPLFARRFGLDRAANFEGRWHLHVYHQINELCDQFDMSEEAVITAIDAARKQLLEAREHRVRPGRDEKILTAWNGLMIKAMALAGRQLEEPRYVASATRALAFVERTLWHNGRLMATHKDGKSHLMAYLDDHAFLIDGILELLQTRWSSAELGFAVSLADVLIERFQDHDFGGFYFTADDHEQLLQRPKVTADEATPSGNGIAAFALARLGHLLAEPRYLHAAERVLLSSAASVKQAPAAHCSLMNALEEYLKPPQVIIVRGTGEALTHWHRHCTRGYAPARLVVAIPSDAQDLPPALAEKVPHGSVTAYICQAMTCSPPITSLDGLLVALAGTAAVFND